MIVYDKTKKTATIDGLVFVRDDTSGYYRNSKTRQRLHRYIWEKNYGKIEKGLDIHHIDGDKGNNEIDNLVLMTRKKHLAGHGKHRAKMNHDWLKKFYTNGVESAKEWHGTNQGREWHKQHYEKTKDVLHAKKEQICQNCGVKYQAVRPGFCSNKCKSQNRRKSGLDDVVRVCDYCSSEFVANKYSKTKTCSHSCANRMRAAYIKKG